MPVQDDGGTFWRRKCRGIATAAILAAIPLWLGACDQLQMLPFDTAQPAASKPATDKPAPVTTEKLAPVALAPTMTGGKPAAAVPPPPSKPAVSEAKAPPPPAAASAAATPAAAPPAAMPVVAAAKAPPPNVSCPTGTIGMWSQDVTGTQVYICRHLRSQP